MGVAPIYNKKGGCVLEAFVDRIIETDRRARGVIENAQREKKRLLEEAKQRAAEELKKQSAATQQGKQAIDGELAQREQAENQKADEAYLAAKRGLDEAFEAHREAWLDEVTKNMLAEG